MPDPPAEPQPFLSRFFDPELRAWRGEQPLGVVFWGYGVLTSSALVLLNARALARNQLIFQQALIVFSACYTAWILVAIWRCSERSDPYWGAFARWLTVAWALNTIFVLAFLQLELMMRYAGG